MSNSYFTIYQLKQLLNGRTSDEEIKRILSNSPYSGTSRSNKILQESDIINVVRNNDVDTLLIIINTYPKAVNFIDPTYYPSHTPLMIGAEHDSYHSVKLLLQHNAWEWYGDKTPFVIALENGHCRTAKELYEYIPQSLAIHNIYGKELLDILVWTVVDDNFKALDKFSDYVKLIDNIPSRIDSDKHALWMRKERVLSECFSYACRFGSLKAIEKIYMLSDRININSIQIGFGVFGLPVLLYATSVDNFELVEFCLRMGADPFVRDMISNRRYENAADIARRNGNIKILTLLEKSMKGDLKGLIKSKISGLFRM